ncbi:hypothetical protein FQN57_006756 [Myotisia sp. PD_48]|nr:hypothetical protein FQN57_006756 [Myotisia sp. PD_48]
MDPPRPSTPSKQSATTGPERLPRAPLTPEQVRRIETNRLKAKAIREQREAELQKQDALSQTSLMAGRKRPLSSVLASSQTPANARDARNTEPASNRPLDTIRPVRNFAKYVEYDFSKMTDTKGGFLTAEDDPHNKALHADDGPDKTANMTQKEWERRKLLETSTRDKYDPFAPSANILPSGEQKRCRECGSLDFDWKWDEIFKCLVCNSCKEKYPEKYSLLTKTEAKEDYLLTDPELKDEELLPHMERPNPHKSTWNNMMLYLRYQVEEYTFSPKKWGSPEGLDEEFEKRESEKKRRKEVQFKTKLQELKKRTRVEAYRRNRQTPGGGGNFGDHIGAQRKHVHNWGRTVDNLETGIGVKSCVDCGMEVEELEF